MTAEATNEESLDSKVSEFLDSMTIVRDLAEPDAIYQGVFITSLQIQHVFENPTLLSVQQKAALRNGIEQVCVYAEMNADIIRSEVDINDRAGNPEIDVLIVEMRRLALENFS